MPGSDSLDGEIEWIDPDVVERWRIPERIVEAGIQLRVAGPSLSITVPYLEGSGVERSRTATHSRVQMADRHPTSDGVPIGSHWTSR